jgi:serine/threonine protein kinase
MYVVERKSLVTRVGTMLSTAIRDGMVTKEQAIAGVRAGIDQLHALGWAHCDITIDNVFVDETGVVFLDDLEYLTPIDSPPPHLIRVSRDARPATARALDELQYRSMEFDIRAL